MVKEMTGEMVKERTGKMAKRPPFALACKFCFLKF